MAGDTGKTSSVQGHSSGEDRRDPTRKMKGTCFNGPRPCDNAVHTLFGLYNNSMR